MSAEIFQFHGMADDFNSEEERQLLEMAKQTAETSEDHFFDCVDPKTLMTMSDGTSAFRSNAIDWLTKNC